MPWQCKTCGQAVATDDAPACPGCQTPKAEWTVLGGRTRAIVITRARFECLRGRVPAPSTQDQPLYAPDALDPTPEARVVRKAAALALARAGQQPASLDLLVVRLYPRPDANHVTLGVEFAQASQVEKAFPPPGSPYVDVPFLCVAGPEPLTDELGFEGLHVVDVTEATERGFAPTVTVKALKQAVVELSTVEADPTVVVHRVETTAARFAQGSGLAMPREELEHHPLLALVVAAGFLADHPDHTLLLAGHASPEGSEKHNRKLAQARADGLAQLVRGERDAWVKTATDHGSLGDIKAYLRYLARERGWPCDPPDTTPRNDDEARAALETFQREFNQRFAGALDPDGTCGVKTLGAVFDVLSHELDRWLEKHGLARAALRLAAPATLGAGEALAGHAALPPGDGRLVDLLLLPPGVGPFASAEALYGDPRLELTELPIADEPGAWETGTLTIVTDLLPDDTDLDERYRLAAADGSFSLERVVSEHGLVRAGGIELEFEGVPTRARLTLTVTSAQGKVATPFVDQPYGALHALSTSLPAQPPFTT